MARITLSFFGFFRYNHRNIQNPNQFRNFTVGGNDGGEKSIQLANSNPIPNQIRELIDDGNVVEEKCIPDQDHNKSYREVAKQVSRITRTRPRWEGTLVDEYPSFNFCDPDFCLELHMQQSNVFLSLRFFRWLTSQQGFVPNLSYYNLLFDALVKAKACNAAKDFLNYTNFKPEIGSIESYILCVCDGGLVEDAVSMIDHLKMREFIPSTATWNYVLSGCLKVGRTDLVWKLYGDMMESNVVADVGTVECLIQAFCHDNNVSKGYELLRQVMEDGFVPGCSAFNKLISGFCRNGYYARISDLLHMMIAKKCTPNIYTYQEVIHGLCKKGKQPEAHRIFNDLKSRGYALDRVMYTTMMDGLCKMGFVGYARKLWFEMIQRGLVPNMYSYNVLIHGYFKNGDLEEACKLYNEMCERGYGHNTVSYNMMIGGFCSHGKIDEASKIFEEMSEKGVARDAITYNALIHGLCEKEEITKGTSLLEELIGQGFEPRASSYTSLIKKFCEKGNVHKAKELLNDMQSRGLKPTVSTYDYMIEGVCKCESVVEGMEWLSMMLEHRLKPKQETFEGLIKSLSQKEMLDDALLVLDSMLRLGYVLGESICRSLVIQLCGKNNLTVETCMGKILEIVKAHPSRHQITCIIASISRLNYNQPHDIASTTNMPTVG